MKSFFILYIVTTVIVCFIIFISMIFFGLYLPNNVELAINILYYIIGSMAVGFFVTGALYIILYMIFGVSIDKILEYYDKIEFSRILLIIVLSIISTYVFFYTRIGDLAVGTIEGINPNYTKLFYRILGAYTVPSDLLVGLIKDRIRRNKYYI